MYDWQIVRRRIARKYRVIQAISFITCRQFNIRGCNIMRTDEHVLIYCNGGEDVLGIITSQFGK